MNNQMLGRLVKMFLIIPLFAVAFMVSAEVSPTPTTLSSEANAIKIDTTRSIDDGGIKVFGTDSSTGIRELEEKREELRRELEKRQLETQREISDKKRELEKARIKAGIESSDEVRSFKIKGDIDGKENLRINNAGVLSDVSERAIQIRSLNREDLKAFEEKREELKNEIEAKREEYKKEIEERREEVKKEIEAKREELKTRLLTIRDEQKKKAVLKIDEEIKRLNERMVEHFSNVLDKMEEVLKGVVSRADKAEAHGLDVSGVRALIVNAELAIDSARASVLEQASKVYEIDITDEDNLRADVSDIRKALRSDLGNLKDIIKGVHTAIRESAVGLAQIPNVDEYEVEEESDEASVN